MIWGHAAEATIVAEKEVARGIWRTTLWTYQLVNWSCPERWCSSREHAAREARFSFAQDDAEATKNQWRKVADQRRPTLPRLAAFMAEAEADVLAYMTFPKDHWQKIYSTNGLERGNGEIKRRTEVVGIFPPPAIPSRFARRNLWPASPNAAAITRLAGAIRWQQIDEWAVQRSCYMTLETIAPLSDDPIVRLPIPAA